MSLRIRVGKLNKLQRQLKAMTAVERLAWAGNLFGSKAVATACLGSDCAVMLHMLSQASPDSRVFVIAPGQLDQETLEAVEIMKQRLGLEVRLMDPTGSDSLAPWGGAPTATRDPLDSALEDAFCWVSDVRQDQAGQRPLAALERLDDGLYQLNPLYDWTQAEIDAYRENHDLPSPTHGGWRAALESQTTYAAQRGSQG